MELVEVARSPQTDERTRRQLVQWAIGLGKTPVVVRDSPGFVVNRILVPYLNEAVLLVGEGMPLPRIDHAMVRFGMPMGPLELLDQVGLDVAAHIARSMQPTFGERFAPNAAFAQLCEKGWLGQKSKIGFYRYLGSRKIVNVEAVAVLRTGTSAGASLLAALPPAAQMQQARERLILGMVNEAAACLGEGLAADADAIDLAMVLGTGWAPQRGGPLHYGAERGYAEVAQALTEMVGRLGLRFEPCAELRRLAGA
jgi:3-hydroxyacyl-CoA dehydrogenase/enoyl-CoA hydratase/3-hydroxybutyryl-CoA epimerase